MQPQIRNIIAAGVAGVVIGAGATAVLMARYARQTGRPGVAALHPGIDPDDVVAVLDVDSARASQPTAGAARPAPTEPRPVDPTIPRLTAGRGDVISDLRSRRLPIPVQGIDPARLVQSFNDRRSDARTHQAIDILAPRHTPVIAVEDGRIARLLMSRAGGLTIYQYDPDDKYVYYYAHLERYADGLKEGAKVQRGQLLGYVGSSGNAPPDTPHLHFAIYETTDAGRWWEGTPVDPFLVLR
ncbi:MAG: M23 family metallopeptidase [Vicinamibacterales bacterium]